MNENKLDSVSLSREARLGQLGAVSPSWVPSVLKRFYDFTRKWAKSFGNEMQVDREEELVKAVAKSFREQA